MVKTCKNCKNHGFRKIFPSAHWWIRSYGRAALPLDAVEPASEIVKRFRTGSAEREDAGWQWVWHIFSEHIWDDDWWSAIELYIFTELTSPTSGDWHMFNHFYTDGHFSEIISRWVSTYGTIGFVCKFLTVLCRDEGWWRRPSNGSFDVGQVCKSQFTLQYPSSNHGVLETPAFIDDFPSFFYPRFIRFFFPSEKRCGWEVLCPMDRFPWRSGFASFGCMVSGTAIGGTT